MLPLPTQAHIYCFPIGNKNGGAAGNKKRRLTTYKKNVGRSTSIEIKSMGMRYMHNVAQKQVGSAARRQLER